ncbi:MAG: metal-dependent hydrolase [Acidobacteriota bacterium]|nr:metal-dependent hydrolase [Acidobacteriota bacterium]
MDIATHALASLALSRAVFPRTPKVLWAWTISAGVIADIDGFSALVNPSVYLEWYRTYTHSLPASLVLSAIFAVVYRAWASSDLRPRLSVQAIFLATLLVQWLHLAMDAAQWQGVELLWPFNHARIAADWLPSIDPWIITILIATVLLPEFFHLVSSEIGVKDKRPRGFVGAITGLGFVVLYVGLRAELHASAVAQLQNRAYVGESPRTVAAFSEFTSLVSWNGIAETESALHEVTARINSPRGAALDLGINLYKPDPSAMLQAAQETEAAKHFLRVARFPRAMVQKMDSGTEIQIRDVRYAAAGEKNREPMVSVDFDLAGKIISEGIVWAGREASR